MIGYLRGLVIERRSTGENTVEIVVDVNGVGYRVLVTPRLAAAVVPGDGEIALAVHTHVRESAIALYGFSSSKDRDTFELLIGAHGVGPALALGLLSVHDPDHLAGIVADGDVEALMLVPGIGKKTAARLLLELKARFDRLGDLGTVVPRPGESPGSSAMADASEALAQLGYGTDEIRSVLRPLASVETPEELLRLALRELAPRR